jgi:phosphoheptose isomerase
MKNYADQVGKSILSASRLLAESVVLKEAVSGASLLFSECLRDGFKILAFGNGGSAADSQHFVAELLVRFTHNRLPLPAVSLCVDPSVVTSIGNDFGFERVFSRQIEGLGKKGDTVLAISTSGASNNIIEAVKTAKGAGLKAVILTGEARRELSALADVSINVPSQNTANIQEVHAVVLHILCDLIEDRLGLK